MGMLTSHAQHKKLAWFYAPCFTAFWLVLYAAVVLQQVNRLPTPLTLQDEVAQPDAFIAERAEKLLLNLTSLGPRVIGSRANEVEAVNLILDQIFKIQNEMYQNYFDIEVDLQVVSGQFVIAGVYQGVQNILAKLSAKNNTSTNYLLINAHFDSTPRSPGASDDGAMVAVMLEILRVMANSKGPLEHPIVFLFNGAEEDGLLASHGFTTQHKWAKNCKVVINLDAAGSGGREILFQSIAESSWLMNYYSEVPHPFANALVEELFQFRLVPSDTDFRNFRDYGGMQGFDMAYIYNGYVYHTEFDSFNVYIKASLQNTGDNVLSLAKSLGNAPEMWNINNYSKTEHFIFFDFLGWFVIYYTMNTSFIINIASCVAALIAIIISLYWMSKQANLRLLTIVAQFMLTTIIQILSLTLGAGFSMLISYVMDMIGYSMSWFSNSWLICGLYFCPVFFFAGILPAIFLQYTKKIPLYLLFRRTRSIILCSLGVTIIFIILAITPIGIPYTPHFAPQRYQIQHVNQVYHNADGSIRSNESAIYLYQQDRHIDIAEEIINRFRATHETSTVCNNEDTCQLNRPSIFYTPNSLWLAINVPPSVPDERPVLTLTAKTIMDTPNTIRYNYTLTGPDHMMVFIEPKASAKVKNWSFDKTMLRRKTLVFTFVYGKNNDALKFFMDLEHTSNNTSTPNLEIGIAGIWVHQPIARVKIYEEFLESLPNYATKNNWLSTYDSWLF